jgi:ADP-ribose pyrophosphatase YjhB (NUDIX family)
LLRYRRERGKNEMSQSEREEFVLTTMRALVLPYGIQRGECGVVLLRRRNSGRELEITTAGGYRRKNEGAYDCARRSLLDQLGIETSIIHASVARVCGHPGQEVVQCFTTETFHFTKKPELGCERVLVSLREALGWALDGRLTDDSTTIQILALHAGLTVYSKIRPIRF